MVTAGFYIFAIIFAFVTAAQSLFNSFKWMFCIVTAIYLGVWSSSELDGMLAESLPGAARLYTQGALILVVSIVVLALLLMAVEKITPASELYSFIPLVEKVLGFIFRFISGYAVISLLIFTAVTMPLPQSCNSFVDAPAQSAVSGIRKISALVDKFSCQSERTTKRTEALDAMIKAGRVSADIEKAAPAENNTAPAAKSAAPVRAVKTPPRSSSSSPVYSSPSTGGSSSTGRYVRRQESRIKNISGSHNQKLSEAAGL